MSPQLPVSEAAFFSAADFQAASVPQPVLVLAGRIDRARYWDMHIAGYPGYSFAEHVTAHGFAVVGADRLGVGASSKPADGDEVDFDTMSAAAASFVEQVRASLADGSPEFGGTPLPEIRIIGVGHSLGACLTVVTQARHRCYDAVAVLGFTHGQKEVAVTAVGATEREPAATPTRCGRLRSGRRAPSSEKPGTTYTGSRHASRTTPGCIAPMCRPP